MALPWQLTGRAAELQRVREALARRESGVLFAGAAGVGKTRVAREAEATARAAQRPTAWVAATGATTGIPLGVFSTVVPAAAARAASTPRLIGHVVGAVEELSRRRRALVCVDDAQLLDDVSAAVVHQLALRSEVTLVVTVRTGPAPDAITALWKDGLLDRVELAGLSDEAMAELLETALDGPVETSARQRLLAMAAGNVLLLRHLVEGELAAGRLVNRQRCWHWRAARVPDRIRDLLVAQLGAVDAEERQAIELLALAEPLPLACLDRIVGRDAVQRTESDGLLAAEDDAAHPRVRLAHPMYAEVLREQIRPLRARALRTALVDALAGPAATDQYWSLRRCVLALDSDAEVAAADLHAAAGAAMALLDEPLAERLCRAALERSPSFESRLRLGYSLIRQERRAEGAAILRELAADSSETQLAIAVRPIAASLFWDDDDPDQAMAVLRETRATLRSPVAIAAVDALDASFAAFLADGDRAARLSDGVLAQSRIGSAAVAWACAAGSMAAAAVGRARRVDELSPRGWAAALDSDTERFLVLPLTNATVLAYGRSGEFDRAAAAVDRFVAVSGDLPSAQARSATLLFRGQLALWRGELPEAARLLEDAVLGFGDPPGAPTCWAVQCLTAAVLAHAAQGDAAAARDAMVRLERHDRTALTIFAADVELASACVSAAEGAVSQTIELAAGSARTARTYGLAAAEVDALHRMVRWGDVRGVDRLVDLAAAVDGPRAALAGRHGLALRAGDAAGLASIGDEWARLGAVVLAADAYAQAAAVRSAGGPDLTGTDAGRARRLAAERHARTPALVPVLIRTPGGGRLTRREREVATLAAEGMSNAEIAGRLSVSTRTVEGHLLQAYDKLGVHSRAALATVWSPRR
jgi:DNA-binding CsgD family transcriptional regulator